MSGFKIHCHIDYNSKHNVRVLKHELKNRFVLKNNNNLLPLL